MFYPLDTWAFYLSIEAQIYVKVHIQWVLHGPGADAIKKITPSLGIPYLGV